MNITKLFFASMMMIAAVMNAEPISSPNISYNNKLLPT